MGSLELEIGTYTGEPLNIGDQYTHHSERNVFMSFVRVFAQKKSSINFQSSNQQ
jgi:hypothetical protein